MKFTEKLVRLTDGENKSKIARSVGLSPTAITDYIQKGYIPKIDNALALAKALDVPLEWLADDSQDWPPPARSGGSADCATLSDQELMLEVCRRYRLIAVRLHEELNRAESIDWHGVAQRLLALPLGGDVPPDLARDARLPTSIGQLLSDLLRFDPSLESVGLHGRLPGHKIDPEALTSDRLISRRLELWDRLPGYAEVQQFYGFLERPPRGPKARERAEEWRTRFAADLAASMKTFRRTGTADRSGKQRLADTIESHKNA